MDLSASIIVWQFTAKMRHTQISYVIETNKQPPIFENNMQ